MMLSGGWSFDVLSCGSLSSVGLKSGMLLSMGPQVCYASYGVVLCDVVMWDVIICKVIIFDVIIFGAVIWDVVINGFVIKDVIICRVFIWDVISGGCHIF